MIPVDVEAEAAFGKLTGTGESRWPSGKGEWLPTADDMSMIRASAIIELRVVDESSEPLVDWA